jgi:hypothetical protein
MSSDVVWKVFMTVVAFAVSLRALDILEVLFVLL